MGKNFSRLGAQKLVIKKNRCQGNWVATRKRCNQVAKYMIGNTYYCTTHAKIRALEELLDE